MERKNKSVIAAVCMSAFIFLVSYASAQSAPVSFEATVPDKIEYKGEGFRDPFQVEGEGIERIIEQQTSQQTSEISQLPPLEIQGIVWGGRFPQAIINNNVLKIGDTIEGVQIIDITKSGINVSFANRQYNLSSPASLNLLNIKEKP